MHDAHGGVHIRLWFFESQNRQRMREICSVQTARISRYGFRKPADGFFDALSRYHIPGMAFSVQDTELWIIMDGTVIPGKKNAPNPGKKDVLI